MEIIHLYCMSIGFLNGNVQQKCKEIVTITGHRNTPYKSGAIYEV